MASPAVQGTPAESATTTAGTSHTVTLPTGIQVGELLVIIGSSVAASTFTLSGWTELLDENAARGLIIYVRQADGTEGASVSISSSASIKPAFIAYRVSGAADPGVTAPTLGTTATGTSVNPNPPNCNPGVSKDYLSLAFYTLAGEEADDDTWTTAAPASYTNLRQKTAGTAGSNTSAAIASAQRALTAVSSEDPGTFTTVTSVSNAWRANTMLIHPAPPPSNQNVDPTGLASAESFGTTTAHHALDLSGLGSAGAFGTPTAHTAFDISGLGSAGSFGTPTVDIAFSVSGLGSAGEFGVAEIADDSQPVDTTGLGSAGALGTPTADITFDLPGLSSAAAFGVPTAHMALEMVGLGSAGAFGTLTMDQTLEIAGLGSAGAFGAISTEGGEAAAQIRRSYTDSPKRRLVNPLVPHWMR